MAVQLNWQVADDEFGDLPVKSRPRLCEIPLPGPPTHFLMKTLQHVPTEINLYVLAYNLKRLTSLLGIAETMKAMRFARA